MEAGSCELGRLVVGVRSFFSSCERMHCGHVNGASPPSLRRPLKSTQIWWYQLLQ